MLFVVWANPPLCSSTTPSDQQTTAAHPPGPGLRRHAPSVQTSTSPETTSGRSPGSDLDRRRELTAIERQSTTTPGGVDDADVCKYRWRSLEVHVTACRGTPAWGTSRQVGPPLPEVPAGVYSEVRGATRGPLRHHPNPGPRVQSREGPGPPRRPSGHTWDVAVMAPVPGAPCEASSPTAIHAWNSSRRRPARRAGVRSGRLGRAGAHSRHHDRGDLLGARDHHHVRCASHVRTPPPAGARRRSPRGPSARCPRSASRRPGHPTGHHLIRRCGDRDALDRGDRSSADERAAGGRSPRHGGLAPPTASAKPGLAHGV